MSERIRRFYRDGLELLRVLIFGLLCSVLLRAQQSGDNLDNKPLPKFEAYPVFKVWKGSPAPLKLLSTEERLFRTALREAAKRPPDFAGHYRFAIWGCGTRCVGGALIDLQTGLVFAPPLAHKANGEEHWIFCTDWDKKRPLEYRVGSRLFVLQCGSDTYYFLWEKDSFQQIRHLSGENPG